MGMTEKEFQFYLRVNCEKETLPMCSDCYDRREDVYLDHLDGESFCEPCLRKSLSKDTETLESLREDMKGDPLEIRLQTLNKMVEE